MNMHAWAELIRHMSLFTWVRQSVIVYPVVLSTHLSCIALFGGLILVTNLRLFGLVLTRYSIASVVRQLRPWKWLGLIIMVTMGVLLAGSRFTVYYDNPYFQMKIGILLLILVHGIAFRKSVYRDETVPVPGGAKSSPAAKLAGTLSLVLWISVVTMGRWIAYYDYSSPLEANLNRPSPAALVVADTHTPLAPVASSFSLRKMP